MDALGILLIVLIVGLPVAWLIAEFKADRAIRISLGVLAFGVAILCTSGLSKLLTQFNYNARFGGATKELIATSVAEIEDGHLERVLKVWRGLNSQYRPTYENRAGYFELVTGAVEAMKRETPLATGSVWDSQPFDRKTWIGYWENETGFWIVINDSNDPFDVTRSGDAPLRMHSVTVSADHAVFKFKEGEAWLHTLTLTNKYEATHEWFDLKNQKIWQTDTLHKLRRATEAEKGMTRKRDTAQSMNPR